MKLNQDKGNIGVEWILSMVWFSMYFWCLKLQCKIKNVLKWKGTDTTKGIESQMFHKAGKTGREVQTMLLLLWPTSSWNPITHPGEKTYLPAPKLFHYLVICAQLLARSVSLPLARIVTTRPLGCVNTEANTSSLLMTSWWWRLENRESGSMRRSWSRWQMLSLCPCVCLSPRLHKHLSLTCRSPPTHTQAWAVQWLHRKWSIHIHHYSSY